MKKYFWILLLIPSLCFGATGDLETINGKVDTAISTIAGKAGTAIATICGKNYTDGDAGCTTAHVDNTGGTEKGNNAIGSATTNYWVGQTAWNPGENISICKVTVNLSLLSGSITSFHYHAAIYTLNGTALDALQGTSDAVTGSDAWNDTNVDFTFSTPVDVTNGTDYAVVVYKDGAADAVNNATYNYTADGALDGNFARWKDDKTQDNSNTRDMKMAVYK